MGGTPCNWDSLTNIPEEFNPSEHNHEIEDINNLQNELVYHSSFH